MTTRYEGATANRDALQMNLQSVSGVELLQAARAIGAIVDVAHRRQDAMSLAHMGAFSSARGTLESTKHAPKLARLREHLLIGRRVSSETTMCLQSCKDVLTHAHSESSIATLSNSMFTPSADKPLPISNALG